MIRFERGKKGKKGRAGTARIGTYGDRDGEPMKAERMRVATGRNWKVQGRTLRMRLVPYFPPLPHTPI